jgi:ComF family protein
MPEEREAECWRCRTRRPAFSGVRSVFVYDGAARKAVHSIKFRGTSALAPVMGSLMAEQLQWWRGDVKAIVPVPLAGHRRRTRGYNQSELLAREVARLTGLPLVSRALVRRRATAPQARQPGEQSRHRNVAGAFRAGSRVPSGGILLIDDVVTTGATLDACARVLLNEGAGPVFALTFARED